MVAPSLHQPLKLGSCLQEPIKGRADQGRDRGGAWDSEPFRPALASTKNLTEFNREE
jgi:hypothetical protein